MGTRLRRIVLATLIGALSAFWLNAPPAGSVEADLTPAIPLAPNSPDRANVIGPEGGTVVTPDGRIQISVPAGALEAPAWILPAATLPYGSARSTTAFELDLVFQSLIGPSSPVDLSTPASLRLTVLAEDATRLGRNADSLSLKSDDSKHDVTPATSPAPGTFEANISAGGHFVLSSDAPAVGGSASRIYSSGTTSYIAGPGNILWHQADQHAGAASYVVPIPLLPGPAGFKPPDPNLTYYSSRVDEMKHANAMGSWAGIGWDASIPAIRRDPATNRYYLDLYGTSDELIQTGTDPDGSTKWSTRNEQYQRIRSKTVDSQHAVFIVTQKDGTQYRFGTRDNLDSPDTGLLRWYWVWNSGWQKQYYRFDVGRIIDTHSNYADYTYIPYTASYCPGGGASPPCQTVVKAAYPSYINWGANSAADNTHKFRIQFFTTEQRADAPCTQNQPPVIETRRLAYARLDVYESSMWKQQKQFLPGYQVLNGDCAGAGAFKLSSLAVKGTDGSTLHTYTFGYGTAELPIEYKHASQTCLSFTWPYLQTITNGFGATTTFTYASKWQAGAAGTDPNCSGGSTVATWSRQVLATRSENPGLGTSMEHTYTYTEGPRYYRATGINPIDAEFRGFKIVRDSNGIGAGPFDYTECKHYTTGTEEDGWPGDILTGHPFRCEWFESTGGPSVKLWTPTWSFRYVAAGVNFVFLYEDLSYFGSAVDRSYPNWDLYGNLYDTSEYVPAVRRRVTEFYPNTTAWIVSLPAAQITYAAGGVIKSKMTYLYDLNTTHSQAPTKGDRVREDHYDDADVAHTRWVWGYDGYGNRISETKKRDGTNSLQKITVADSTYHAYLSTETITSITPNHVTSYSYDFVLGQQITKTDPNLQQWHTRYDVHGRVDKEWSPGDSETFPTVDYTYNWDSTAPNQTVTKRLEQAGSTNTLNSWKWKDGLDRTVQTRAESPSCAADVMVTDIAYDVTGQVTSRTSPYSSNNTSCVAGGYATTPSAPKTQYLYDVLGRETQVANPHQIPFSIRTTTYTGFTETMIDEKGHKTERIKDAFDRVVTVKEYSGTNPAFTLYANTTFEYDVLDRQTRVTDHFGNDSETFFNILGFVTSTDEMDRGTWTYTYYDDGLLKRKSDARLPTPQYIDYAYDSLDRITSKMYGGYSSPATVNHFYDVTPDTYANGSAAPSMPDGSSVGRLTRVTDWAGERLHSYDARGRETDERHVIQGSTYDVGHAYDPSDREFCTAYPDGEKVGATYDSQGVIATLKQYPNAGCTGTSTATYLSGTTFNEAGLPTTLALGNGLNNSFGYRSTDWRLTGITASSLLNYTYDYDAKGNISSMGDTLEGTTATFAYDDQDRLDHVTGLPSTTIDYSYNEIGNLLSKQEGTSNYTSMAYPSPGLPRPHGINQANYAGGWHTFEYDDNGNTRFERDSAGGTVHEYLYNAEAQVSNMSSPGQSPAIVSYYYDSEGTLVRKQPLGEATGTVYVGGIYERNNAGEITKYYFADGRRIAQRKGAGMYFLSQDHQGGTALATDSTGGMISRTRFFPYGVARTMEGASPTDRLFAGQRQETANGIYRHGVNLYNADLGKLQQVVSVGSASLDPQALNSYAFSRSNPLAIGNGIAQCGTVCHPSVGNAAASITSCQIDVWHHVFKKFGRNWSGQWGGWALCTSRYDNSRLCQADISRTFGGKWTVVAHAPYVHYPLVHANNWLYCHSWVYEMTLERFVVYRIRFCHAVLTSASVNWVGSIWWHCLPTIQGQLYDDAFMIL